jgi:cellulose synthase/poly-beta-1,6-N-acetylglucosamine synthase-like glycosyltransferase
LRTTPGVSVVVPVRNGAATIAETLRSIAAQNDGRQPFEIIVVEDGSDDGSRGVVERAAMDLPLTILQGPRRGAAAAVNAGLRAASHPIVAQVDQDVVLEREWLARLLPHFDDLRVGAAQGRYTADRSASFFSRVMALDLEQRYVGLPDRIDHVCTGNTVYRAEALARVGLLDESFGYGYDNDLSYRLGAAGYALVFCREARSRHRWREGLAGYLRQQYGFGYGRLDVVAAHPDRLAGDAVSPGSMMSQPALMLAALVCLILSAVALVLDPPISRSLAIAGASLVVVLAVERFGAGIRAWRRFHDPAALAFPLVHLARNVAWVAAIGVWVGRRLVGREASPGASMKPRQAR